jgi:hypothetical protein
MEISDVKRRLLDTIESARKAAAGRRARIDEAGREYEPFLERIAVPLFRQAANVLRAEGYPFTVFTPGGSVRLMSDRTSEDYIELMLDTSGDEPKVIGRTSRSRGRRVIEAERPIASGAPARLAEEDVLDFLAKELTPFVER